jgi:hypothetical protein
MADLRIFAQPMAAVPPTAAFGVIGNVADTSRIADNRRAVTRYSMPRLIAA